MTTLGKFYGAYRGYKPDHIWVSATPDLWSVHYLAMYLVCRMRWP